MEEMIERVDKLRETDSHDTDSIKKLAEEEFEIWKTKIEKGYTKAQAYEQADELSDKELKYIEAKKAGWIDSETGMRNRNALNGELPNMINYEAREKHSFGLLMADVDEFKSINDRLGHKTGDEAIKKIGNVISKALRPYDALYRYGGDELVIFLPNLVRKEIIEDISERIRRTVESAEIEVTDNENNIKKIKVTLSIGYVLSNGSKEIDDLIKRVDFAMNEAKKSGKNRAVMYEEKNI
jgi:diguanylate cyclase (GGDEF)-like protein